MIWYDMTILGGCLRFQPTVIDVFRVEDMQTTQHCYFIHFILCFLTIHFKCSHISLVLISWNSEDLCFTWNGVLAWPAWPGRHENPADGGPPSWDGRCIEDLARWNQGQLMVDETNAIPRYTKVTVLWSRLCWTSCLLFWESMRFVSSVSSVAVVMIHVLDAKYTGTFAYVKQRAPVAVSDRAMPYYILLYIHTHTHTLRNWPKLLFLQTN